MKWRLAMLLRRGDGDLDVAVMDEEANKPNKIHGPHNYSDQQVIGVSNFRDNRSSTDILMDFVTVHGTPRETEGISRGTSFSYVKYIPQYEATIPLAFVTYFSKLR